MEKHEDIWYLDCPHFTMGRVDQGSERGYLLFNRKVYFYEVDRKDQCSSTSFPRSIEDFLVYAKENRIGIPDEFAVELGRAALG